MSLRTCPSLEVGVAERVPAGRDTALREQDFHTDGEADSVGVSAGGEVAHQATLHFRREVGDGGLAAEAELSGLEFVIGEPDDFVGVPVAQLGVIARLSKTQENYERAHKVIVSFGRFHCHAIDVAFRADFLQIVD